MDVDSILHSVSTIVSKASSQLGVSVNSNKSQVVAYIQDSGGSPLMPEKRSWCGDFAYWVIHQAKISPLPDSWHPAPKPLGSNAIPRFFKRFPVTKHPLPGDMYYRRKINGRDVEHVGFVENPDLKPGFIGTLDGNAGGANADWSLGLGGGCVSRNETPLSGPERVDRFLQVATDAEIEGRWWVEIGVWTWNYIFTDDGQAWCTDIKDTATVRFKGTWEEKGGLVSVKWIKTGSEERWNLPLFRAGQQGNSPNRGYSLNATKIETKEKVAATEFRFKLD
jgi:hypothetical protein